MRIGFDPLISETAQRLYGISALIEMICRAVPGVEIEEREALKQLAEREGWEAGDYAVEDQFLDIKSLWLDRLSGYSVVVLLSSVVETQLLAYAKRVGQREKSVFDPDDLKGSVLEKAAVYVKKVSSLELTKNSRWKTLKDLQEIRNVIVHRAGRPGNDKATQLQQMLSDYGEFGLSIGETPYSSTEPGIRLTVHLCRYFAQEVETFFKDLFQGLGLPVTSGLWPNIQSGFPQKSSSG
ncbi:MAG TPA: hypothetical protein VMT20_19010 [Terriglobia bacterium]|nr:hypothetical protein [Terriglobia bacterium]